MLLRLRTIIPEGDLRNPTAEAGMGQSRSQTPTGGCGKGAQQRNKSQSNRSPGKESTLPCYAYSREPKNCRGPLDGCTRQRRGLTDAEKLKCDKYEQAKLDAGQSLGYERKVKRANAAAATVSSTAGDGGSRAS
eukprot:5482671-Pyramimonas_sp.AAC.1